MQILYGHSLLTDTAFIIVILSSAVDFTIQGQGLDNNLFSPKPIQKMLQEAKAKRSQTCKTWMTQLFKRCLNNNPQVVMRDWFYLATVASVVGAVGLLETIFFR